MADLVAIVRATRRSAKALDRMGRTYRQLQDKPGNLSLQAKYQRARRDYVRAQEILAANPLPSNRT